LCCNRSHWLLLIVDTPSACVTNKLLLPSPKKELSKNSDVESQDDAEGEDEMVSDSASEITVESEDNSNGDTDDEKTT